MKNAIILLFVASASLLFAACKERFTFYPLTNQDLITAATIKEGSYFCYVDSLTNTRDSFHVRSWVNVFYEVAHVNQFEMMKYIMDNGHGTEFIVLTTANTSQLNCAYTIEKFESFSTIVFLNFPFLAGSVDSSEYNKWEYLAHYDSISVRSKTYRNVYEIRSRVVGQHTAEIMFHSFYSVENGLIKFSTQSMKGSNVWELDSAHIVK